MTPMPSKEAWAKIIADGWNPGDEAIKAIMDKKDELIDPRNDVLSGLVQAIADTQAQQAPMPEGMEDALQKVVDLFNDDQSLEKYQELLVAIQELKELFPKQLEASELSEQAQQPAEILTDMLTSMKKGEQVDSSILFVTASNLENQVKTKIAEITPEPKEEPVAEPEAKPEEPTKQDELRKSYISTFERFRDRFARAQNLKEQSGILNNYYRIIKVLSGKDVPKFGEEAKAYVKTLAEQEEAPKDDIIVTSNVVLRHMDKIEDILDAYKEQTEAGTIGSNRLFLKYGEGDPKKFLMKILGIALKDINALHNSLASMVAPIGPGKLSIKEAQEEESVEDIIEKVTNAYEAILPEGEKILASFQQIAKGEVREQEEGSIKAQAERIYNIIEPITKYFPSINPFGTNYGHDEVLEDFRATTKGLVSLVTQINRYAKDGDINRPLARSAIQKLQEIKTFLKDRFGISDTAKKAGEVGSLTPGQGEGYKAPDAEISTNTFKLTKPEFEPEEEIDTTSPDFEGDEEPATVQVTPSEEPTQRASDKARVKLDQRRKRVDAIVDPISDLRNEIELPRGITKNNLQQYLRAFFNTYDDVKQASKVQEQKIQKTKRARKTFQDIAPIVSAAIGEKTYNEMAKRFAKRKRTLNLPSGEEQWSIVQQLIVNLLQNKKIAPQLKRFFEEGKYPTFLNQEQKLAEMLKPIIERILNG
jgi:hypothetical protein